MSLIEEVRAARALPHPSTAKVIRRAAGVSQKRMADELHVDRTTLARWEAGTMRPRHAQLLRWQQLLDQLQREVAS